jgi:hypothetical protein
MSLEIANQIAKDAEIVSQRLAEGVEWHFYTSPVTGLGGPSAFRGSRAECCRHQDRHPLIESHSMLTLAYNVNSNVHQRMAKKEVDAFFSWFMSVMPACLEELIEPTSAPVTINARLPSVKPIPAAAHPE